MKKYRLAAVLLTLVFILSIPIATIAGPAHKVSGDSALSFIADLTQWKRIAGSEAEQEAAVYIENTFQSYGYETRLQEFDIMYYEEIDWDLAIVEPAGAQELSPNIMMYSPAGDVTAALVYAGLGGPGDFDGVDVEGKIALIQRGAYYFRDKVANAAAHGAIGAVIFNNLSGNFRGTLGEPGAIPVVSLSLEEGSYLLDLMEQGEVKVNLMVDSITEERISQNVIATKPAGRGPGTGKTIIIGGHYDNVSAGFGANDNASGTAVVMEVARIFKNYPLAADVKFIAFGAEEIGLEGSYYYAVNMSQDEIDNTIGMINLDMVGVGDTLMAGDMAPGDGRLVELTRQIGSELGHEVNSFQAASNSDHTYFELLGIPVTFLTWRPDLYYHTPEDTIDKIIPSNLEIAGEISAEIICELIKLPARAREAKAEKPEKVSVFKGKQRALQ